MLLSLAFLLFGAAVAAAAAAADHRDFLPLAANFSNQSIFLMSEDPIFLGVGAVTLSKECKETYSRVMRTFNVGARVDFRRRKLSNIWKRLLDMCADIVPTVNDCFDKNATKVDNTTGVEEDWKEPLVVLAKIRRDLGYRMSVTELLVEAYQLNTEEGMRELGGKSKECAALYWKSNDGVLLKLVEDTRSLVQRLRATFNTVKNNPSELRLTPGEHGFPPFFHLAYACSLLSHSGVLTPLEASLRVDNCLNSRTN